MPHRPLADTAKKSLQKTAISRRDIISGIKAGLPIAIGIIPTAIAFGLLARSTGIPNEMTILMSAIVFAGASQFIAVQLLGMGAASWEIIITTFIINFRHFLMSSSLARRIKEGTSSKVLSILAFGITDETFSIASLQNEKMLNPQFILGLNFAAYFSWTTGTAVGLFLASGLPQAVQSSMGIALYAMFIGLLVPSFRGSKKIVLVAVIAVVINSLLNFLAIFSFLSSSWSIIISTIIAAAAGTILFPEGVD